MPWHKNNFSDLVPGTRNEGLGYFIIFEFLLKKKIIDLKNLTYSSKGVLLMLVL